MSLLKPRVSYRPVEYPTAVEFWEKQQQAHWLHLEISMAGDLQDWHQNLTETEKHIVGQILKGFTQTEVFIEDYWSNKVANWFKKPEIQDMANTFAAFESIHAKAYNYLNETLGLDDFEAFLTDETTKAKIDRLMTVKGKTHHDKALSLAVFSAFNEGVNLFSSFAILMNFSRFNKLKGVGEIVAFSVKDESMHSNAGVWLFNQFISEYPEIFTDDFKKEIYEAARLTVKLEDDFIDQVFKMGNPEGLDKDDLKNYIRFRTNTKLEDLGLKKNWKNIDQEALSRMEWFDVLASGKSLQDFFAGRVVDYAKGTKNWSKIWE